MRLQKHLLEVCQQKLADDLEFTDDALTANIIWLSMPITDKGHQCFTQKRQSTNRIPGMTELARKRLAA